MKNENHYIKISQRKVDSYPTFINKRNWWKAILILATFIFAGLFLPSRFTKIDYLPKTGEEYWQDVTYLSLLVALMIPFYIWPLLIKPYLNSRKGYNLMGQFVVKEKFPGKQKLLLTPGTKHMIKVDKQFFKFIKVGDRILVERRPLGEVIKVKKI